MRLVEWVSVGVVAAVGMLAIAGTGEVRGSGPDFPPDCNAASEATVDGPEAPSGLFAVSSWYLFDAPIGIYWQDNSDDETCFVLERKLVGGEWELDFVLSANQTHHQDFGGGGRWYRIYAANAAGRSEYSNEVFHIPATPPPTPEPTPSPSASPTPYPQSTITVRFVQDGEPVTVRSTYTGATEFAADGATCPRAAQPSVTALSQWSMQWPLHGNPVQACAKGPPTDVRIGFSV